MGKSRALVSLTTDDNDYQQLQAADAEQTAQTLGVELKITFAKNDAVEQSTELLRAMQSSPELRPNGIILEPVGTNRRNTSENGQRAMDRRQCLSCSRVVA